MYGKHLHRCIRHPWKLARYGPVANARPMSMAIREFASRSLNQSNQSNQSNHIKSSIISKLVAVSLVAGISGLGIFFFYKDPRSSIHKYVIMPLGRLALDAEDSHRLAVEVYKYPSLNPSLSTNWSEINDPKHQLHVELFTASEGSGRNPNVKPLKLQTPLGMAAGFDKNAEAVDTLFNLGFSLVEVGSVTPLPQPGNPKPRVFRLDKDNAVVNRYGFNSQGHSAVLVNLKMRIGRFLYKNGVGAIPVNNALRENRALAVNLGKNKTGDEINDYIKGVETFGPFADILVINVSSPNTPGLRDLQNEQKLTKLLTSVVESRDQLPLSKTQTASLPPVVVKIAPDLSEPEIESIAAAVKASKVDGVIVSNTTIRRPSSLRSPYELASETGGLSGPPVKPFSLQALKFLRKHLGDYNLTVIGCGGISNGQDAIEFAQAGADFVELYTAFAYQGAGIAEEISLDILNKLGESKWKDLINKKTDSF